MNKPRFPENQKGVYIDKPLDLEGGTVHCLVERQRRESSGDDNMTARGEFDDLARRAFDGSPSTDFGESTRWLNFAHPELWNDSEAKRRLALKRSNTSGLLVECAVDETLALTPAVPSHEKWLVGQAAKAVQIWLLNGVTKNSSELMVASQSIFSQHCDDDMLPLSNTAHAVLNSFWSEFVPFAEQHWEQSMPGVVREANEKLIGIMVQADNGEIDGNDVDERVEQVKNLRDSKLSSMYPSRFLVYQRICDSRDFYMDRQNELFAKGEVKCEFMQLFVDAIREATGREDGDEAWLKWLQVNHPEQFVRFENWKSSQHSNSQDFVSTLPWAHLGNS